MDRQPLLDGDVPARNETRKPFALHGELPGSSPSGLGAVDLAPMLEREIGIALPRKRARAPVGKVHLVPVPAFSRAGVLRPLTTRRVVHAADKGRRYVQGLARRDLCGAERWMVLVIGAIELGHGRLHGIKRSARSRSNKAKNASSVG